MRVVNALIFNALFAREQSKHLLIYLLNALLNYDGEKKIVAIELLNPFNEITYIPQKNSILDIKAKDQSGAYYNIEVQLNQEKDFVNRVIFYSSRIIADQLQQGDPYVKITKTVSISLIENWKLFPEKASLHNIGRLRLDGEFEILTDLVEYHFIELSKFDALKLRDKQTRFEKWLSFLKYTPELPDTLREEIENEEGIKMAIEMYKTITSDDLIREQYRREEIAERDINWRLQNAMDSGFEKGVERGIKKGEERGIKKGEEIGIEKGRLLTKQETARSLKMHGVAIEIIIATTGFSKEEIESL